MKMPIGIALVLIFVLYLIDKHDRWRQTFKLTVGLVAPGLFVILPLLVSARPQQSARASIPQTTREATAPPVTQRQIKVLESEIAQLKIEVAYLRLERGTATSDSLDEKADKSDLDDKADKSDLRRMKSDLDDKADKSDLDDKADKSSVDDLESKVKGLYCHLNLRTEGILGGWPPSCF